MKEIAVSIGVLASVIAVRTYLQWRGGVIMASAVENLTSAITRLAGVGDKVVTVLQTPHATDAQVQAAADAVNGQSDRLEAAVEVASPSS